MSELTVILKDADKTIKHKFLMYATYTLSPYDPDVKKCIDEAKLSFQGDIESIIITTKMVVQ